MNVEKVGGCFAFGVALLLLSFAGYMFIRSFDREAVARSKVTINNRELATPEEKASGSRIIAGILAGCALIPLSMGFLLWNIEKKPVTVNSTVKAPDRSIALGMFLGLFGLMFSGAGVYFGYQSATEERAAAMKITEDGRPLTTVEEKQPVGRMFAFAFCGGGLVLLMSAYGAIRGTTKRDEALMKGMPDIPVSPTRAAGRGRRALERMTGIPPMYLSPEMAKASINGCAIPLGALAAFLGATWFVWRMPLIVYLFAAVAMAIVGLVILPPAIRTLLAMRKLNIDVTAWTREVHAGGDVVIQFKVTARVPLKIRAINVALVGVEQTKYDKSTERVYLHTETKTVAKELEVGAGWSQDYLGRLAIPKGADPSDAEGATRTCWIVGVTADVPGWSDLEMAREVKVVSSRL